jgi:hypothetical protein
VTLALEGHTLFAGVGSNTAISNSSDGVTGMPMTDLHILEVRGITVQGSTVAISANGQVSGTTGLTFAKNTVAQGTGGISVINLTSSTISENVATGYTVGINIDNAGVTGASPIKLNGNIVIGNPNTGVSITGGFVTAQSNIVSGNGNLGIDVLLARSVEIINNTALANGNFDLLDEDLNCVGTVWSGNTFLRASPSCIH